MDGHVLLIARIAHERRRKKNRKKRKRNRKRKRKKKKNKKVKKKKKVFQCMISSPWQCAALYAWHT
eukprot:12408721-Karenia_brevis.AAC.1